LSFHTAVRTNEEAAFAMTECTQSCFPFAPHFSRDVVARFDGGQITTEAGALLLRPVEQLTGILRQFAACFRDYRRADLVEHSVSELVRQRVYGIALGYEDLNDHDQLRQDPLLALLSGKRDVEGEHRRRQQDRGKAGAGKSTLNRLELTPADAKAYARYKKIVMDEAAVDGLLVDLYIQAQPREPKRIVLDLDATDDPVHGEQEGRFFHGYYGCYCYLPLYIFIDAVQLPFRAPGLRAAAAVEHRRFGRVAGRGPTHRQQTALHLARSEDHPARRLGFLPRRPDELVREEPGRVCLRTGQERAAGEEAAPTYARGARAMEEARQGAPPLPRLPLSHAGILEARAACGG